MNTPKYKKEFGRPYSVCALACIVQVAEWAESQSYKERISLVFELGAPHSGEILEAYMKAQKNPKWRGPLHLGGMCFDAKEAMLPLQAADMLAHQVWTRMVNQSAPMRKPLKLLLQAPNHIGHIDKDRLIQMAAIVDAKAKKD